MTERRYKMYLMNNKAYDIDETDLQKLKDNANEMLVQLKQVMVHPSSISAIEPYDVAYIQKFKVEELKSGAMRRIEDGSPQAPMPLVDLFNKTKQLNAKL